MIYLKEKEQSIEKFLRLPIEENPSIIMEGEGFAVSLKPLPKVSEFIKEYVKEQFAILHSQNQEKEA